MTTHASRFVFGALVIALVGTLAIHEGRGASDLTEHFTAVAINMGTLARTRSGVVDILVLRWSTKAEKDRLAGALLDEGPQALFGALQEIELEDYANEPMRLMLARSRHPAAPLTLLSR